MLDLLLDKAAILNMDTNPIIYSTLSTIAARMKDKIGALDLAKLTFDVINTGTSLKEKAASYALLSEALFHVGAKSTSYNLLKLAISIIRRISDIKIRFPLNLFASYLALEHRDETLAKNLMKNSLFLLHALRGQKYSYETFLLHAAKLYVIYGCSWLESLMKKAILNLEEKRRKIVQLAVARSLVISVKPSIIQLDSLKKVIELLLSELDDRLLYDYALAYALAASIFKFKGDVQTYNQFMKKSNHILDLIGDNIEKELAKISLIYNYVIEKNKQNIKSLLEKVELAIRKKAETITRKFASLTPEKLQKEIERIEDAMIDYVFLTTRASRILADYEILKKAELMAYNLVVPINRARMLLEVAIGYACLKRPNDVLRILNDVLRIISYEPNKLPGVSALILALGRAIALNPELTIDCLRIFDLGCEYVEGVSPSTLYIAFLTEISNELRRLEGTGIEFIPILSRTEETEFSAE